MDQYYNVAGLNLLMDCTGRTFEQAIPYRCDPFDCADITLSSETIMQYADRISPQFPGISEDQLHYLSTGALFYRDLLSYDGMMLHASAVIMDNQAYLFTADSGTGKSTHTSLWLQVFHDQAAILNDDKPAIRLENGKWYAYGTPWSGKHNISQNQRAVIAGVAVLQRSEHNEITQLNDFDAVYPILKQVNRPPSAEHRGKVMELLDSLITTVPVWKLKCNMNPDAALVAYQAMSQGGKL